MTTAVRKLKPRAVNIVSLENRARALIEDMFDAAAEQQIAVLTIFDQMLSDKANTLAEKRRPKAEGSAIPVGWVRRQMDLQGREHLPGARAYFAAIKSN
jgi:hypothetical protein